VRSTDFTDWKRGYENSLVAPQKAVLKEKYLLRSTKQPNEMILLHEVEDLQKAQEFTRSPSYAKGCSNPGVLGSGYFLTDAGAPSPHEQVNR